MPRLATWLSAAGVALPFALALPRHLDPESLWLDMALWSLVAAIFLAAAFAARRIAQLERGDRLVGAFAALFLVLALLNFARAERYAFSEVVTDLALLYIVFYVAVATTRLSAVLGRVVLLVPVIALVLAAVVRAVHAQTFGSEIGAEGYRAILQTNPGEALEFFSRFVGAGVLAAALAALAVALAAAWLALPVRLAGEALAWSGSYALAAAAIVYSNAGLVTERVQGYAEALAFAQDVREYRALREARRRPGPGPAVAQQPPLAGLAQTYVFVIGESLTRNHMSLYGYWRDTTPELARLASELAVFTDVVSPHSHTDPSLERVLTLANDANRLRFTDPQNYSLIELLRAAGFATWWISNQNTFGPWDNKTAVIARSADHQRFLNKGSGAFVTGAYDEILLEPFAAALADPAPRKAIFLHFLGNHWEYNKRYPPEQAQYVAPPGPREIGAWSEVHPKPQLVSRYDNSVLYQDHVAAQVIERLRAARQTSALVLFADHGESLYALRGHYWKEFTRDHVEVPLLLWFSPEYLRVAGDVLERARAGSRQPFALEDLPHLVADVAHLKSPVLEASRSPLSPAYAPPRTRRLFDGQLVYEEADEPLLNARRALDRIAAWQPALRRTLWAHRVNTLGKMMEAARMFAGVEIDVVFDAAAGALLVNHPPLAPSGLTLDEQLEYANRLEPKLSLWLDLKNLSEANAGRVVEELKRLDARHAIRARALVETDHTGPAAALLRAAGFASGYYLPTELVTGSNCNAAAEIERILAARRFAAVSYDFSGRRWVERCLGRAIRELGLKSYTWDLERGLSERGYPEALDEERQRLYPRMAGILLPFRSLFDDWRSITSVPVSSAEAKR